MQEEGQERTREAVERQMTGSGVMLALYEAGAQGDTDNALRRAGLSVACVKAKVSFRL